eukprot:3527572-Pleurochrysis_carterae.AAC.2
MHYSCSQYHEESMGAAVSCGFRAACVRPLPLARPPLLAGLWSRQWRSSTAFPSRQSTGGFGVTSFGTVSGAWCTQRGVLRAVGSTSQACGAVGPEARVDIGWRDNVGKHADLRNTQHLHSGHGAEVARIVSALETFERVTRATEAEDERPSTYRVEEDVDAISLVVEFQGLKHCIRLTLCCSDIMRIVEANFPARSALDYRDVFLPDLETDNSLHLSNNALCDVDAKVFTTRFCHLQQHFKFERRPRGADANWGRRWRVRTNPEFWEHTINVH